MERSTHASATRSATVAVVEPGELGRQVVTELAGRGINVRYMGMSNDWGAVHSQLEQVNADLTLVRFVQGDVGDAVSLRTLVDGADCVMFLQHAVSSHLYDDVSTVVAECRRCRVKQLILRSEVGTSRPWAMSTVRANLKGLRMGWQRRAEDLVRASGVPYTIIKTGAIAEGVKERGYEGVVVGQGDVLVAEAQQRPGMSAHAAGALCASLMLLSSRNCTLEAVGVPNAPSVLERGYSWSNLLGVLMDDTHWEPTVHDALVMHDRATLFYSMVLSALPLLICLIAYVAICVATKTVVEPSIHQGVVEGVTLALCAAAALGTFACFWTFRRILFTGCCCSEPLDYSTRGRPSSGATATSPLRFTSAFPRVAVYSTPANDSLRYEPVVQC